MININLETLRQIDSFASELAPLKAKLEARLNLNEYADNIQSVSIPTNTLLRICLLAGLADKGTRDISKVYELPISANTNRYSHGFFTMLPDMDKYVKALVRMRYQGVDFDWESPNQVSRLIGYEILRGKDLLMADGALEDWLKHMPQNGGKRGYQSLPELMLNIGRYKSNGMDAYIDLNSRRIPNTQVVIAGSTGSGKTNLLVTLIEQIRSISLDSAYPVNFLLFDYKGEFSDPANNVWLDRFSVTRDSILDPVQKPLPFNPFRDMTGKPINEINLYATTLASALVAVFGARVGGNMDGYLRTAINEAYKASRGKAVTFEAVLKEYQKQNPDKVDTVVNSLKTMISSHLFDTKDSINLIENSYIVKVNQLTDGSLARAVIYFTLSKLYSIYQELPVQEKTDDRVEIRHFTVIDEAHHMLDFNNVPLRNLIAEGRNKGMSIILATQSMESYKTEHFDFYANAYYPMIMRQQQVNTSIVSGLFGGKPKETSQICQEISNLKLGEVIMKNNEYEDLGLGERFIKITVNHLI